MSSKKKKIVMDDEAIEITRDYMTVNTLMEAEESPECKRAFAILSGLLSSKLIELGML